MSYTVIPSLDVMQYMYDAGFRYGKGLVNGLAVVYAETAGTLDPKITNTAGNNPPSTDRGLWQLNSYWHSEVSDACAFDPVCSTKEAFRIYSANGGFGSWSAFNNGGYQKYMHAAYATYDGWTLKGALTASLEQVKTQLLDTQKLLGTAKSQVTQLQSDLAAANVKIATLSKGQEDLVAKYDQAVLDRQTAITLSETLEGQITQLNTDHAAALEQLQKDYDLKIQAIEFNIDSYLASLRSQLIPGA